MKKQFTRLGVSAALAVLLAACVTTTPSEPAAQAEPVPADAQAAVSAALADYELIQTERGVVIRADAAVTFESGKADLKPESAHFLDDVALALINDTESHVLIEGHTDNTGSRVFNQELSELRAYTVMKALVDRGVAAERIQAQGFGFTQPIADNSTREGRAENRRIEIVILDELVENLQ